MSFLKSLTKLSFFAKINLVAQKTLPILIITFLSLAILALSFFVAKEYFWASKNLTDYLPVNTQAYFEFQPNNKQLRELYENNFRAKTRLEMLIKETGFWGDFNKELVSEKINKIGLIILAQEKEEGREGERWKRAWLIEAKDLNELIVLLPKNHLAANWDKQVMLLAPDLETLEIFKKPETLSAPTASQRAIFDKFNNRKFLNSYLSWDYLQYVLSQAQDFNQLILNNLDLAPTSPAYFSLRADVDDVVFNFQAASNSLSSYQDLKTDDYTLIKNLPLTNLFSALQVANLKGVVKELEDELEKKMGKNRYAEQKSFLEQKYNFNWADFYDLVANPAVLFFKHQTDRPNFDQLLDRSDVSYGVLVKFENHQKAQLFYLKLKSFLSQYLAFLYPVRQIKDLPDKSQFTQVAADAKSIHWQSDQGLEFFENQDTHLALTQKNDIIYLSEDKNLLQEVLVNQIDNEKINHCPNFSGQEIVYFKTQELVSGWMSFVDQVLMLIDRDGGGVSLKGCFVW